jgi:hypothetical protein
LSASAEKGPSRILAAMTICTGFLFVKLLQAEDAFSSGIEEIAEKSV